MMKRFAGEFLMLLSVTMIVAVFYFWINNKDVMIILASFYVALSVSLVIGLVGFILSELKNVKIKIVTKEEKKEEDDKTGIQ